MPGLTGNIDLPTSSGGVILIRFNLAGSCIFARNNDPSERFFPMGGIGIGEGIIDAGRRVAIEEASIGIGPVGVPLC